MSAAISQLCQQIDHLFPGRDVDRWDFRLRGFGRMIHRVLHKVEDSPSLEYRCILEHPKQSRLSGVRPSLEFLLIDLPDPIQDLRSRLRSHPDTPVQLSDIREQAVKGN